TLSRSYPIRPPWHLHMLSKYFLSPSISLGLTNHFRDLEDRTKNLDLILLKRYNFQKKLLVEVHQLDGANQSPSYCSAPEAFIVDNCKNIYFAGHETTAVTATWCLMLLAAHPDWQDRARAEVLEVCRRQTAMDIDVLRQLKI
ncbi:hypothetical protein ACJX0J_029689, partial [Zea mays]